MQEPPSITIEIIRRADEPRAKCTAMLLDGHPRIRLFHFPRVEAFDPEGKWVLAVGGPELDGELARVAAGDEPAPVGLVLVDTLWRKAEKLLGLLPEMKRVTLPAGWVTAYPRRSKLFDDPIGGLATNEAAYAGRVHTAEDDRSLLNGYRWKEQFLEANQDHIRQSLTRATELRALRGAW